MLRIRDDEFRLAEGSSRVTTACAVKVWDTDAVFVSFGPTLAQGVENYRLVASGHERAYQDRQTAYIENGEGRAALLDCW